MNLGFKIVEYLRGPCRVLYTLKFEDDDKTELDRFLSDPNCKAEPEFDNLVRRLEQMVNKLGFRETFFRKKKYPVPFGYIRYEKSRLRLYCWFDKHAIIVGGGGIKTTRKIAEDPKLDNVYQRILYAGERLIVRRNERDITITFSGLHGNLIFEKEDV